MVKTVILLKNLKAVAHFMAKSGVRYYLKGVCVEVLPTETRVIATTGEILGVARNAVQNDGEAAQVIVPAATVELACKLKSEVLSFEYDGAKGSIGGINFVAQDGKFPDYRRVVPKIASGVAGNYAVDLLSVFGKVAKSLGKKSSPIIRHNGEDAALVHFYADDDFIGVIMPLRHFDAKYPDLGMPRWGAQ